MSREKRDLDGGWAWMVVFGGVILLIVLGGTDRTFGILYVELLDRYGGSAAMTAWVGGIATSLRFFMGPVAAALAERFSYRTVVISGGIIRASGFIIAGYSPNIESLWLTYGVLVGVGGGLVYTNTLVIVAKYFNKRRSLCTGICMAGAGIGTLTFSYLYPFLLQGYGYQGTMLIVGGLTLNICVAGALYRTPDLSCAKKNLRDIKMKEEGVILHMADDHSVQPLKNGCVESKSNQLQNVSEKTNTTGVFIKSLHKDPVYQGDEKNALANAELYEQDTDVSEKFIPCQETKGDTYSNVAPVADIDTTKRLAGCRKVFDYTLLSNVSFVLYAISIMLGTITTISTVLFIPAMGLEHGIDALGTSSLISAIGFTDIFARVLLGLMYDSPMVRPRRQIFYTGIYFLCGVTTLVFAFVRNFVVFAIVAVLFGLCSSSVIPQRSVVLADLIGIERLSTGAGVCAFFQGIGIMVGPVIAGFLKDMMNTYTVCFFFSGACAIFGAGLLFFEYWLRTHSKKTSENKIINNTLRVRD